MNYKKLGSSSLKISDVSFGCMSLGNDHKENASLLLDAVDQGINYFDTADLYGNGKNEITVGKALKEVRSNVIIATKVGNQWRADGSGWDWNPSKKYIIKAVEDSLERLQTNYIDLYQLHGGTINDPIDETIEAFELLKHQGKIRYYGISSIRPNVIREYVKRSHIVSVMMQYSLLDRRPEESCLPLLFENNIGVLARGSLAGGLLINKPSQEYPGHTAEQVALASEAIAKISGSIRSKTDAAIQFVLSEKAISSAVVGIRSKQQLNEAVHASAALSLSADEVNVLQRAVVAGKYGDHR